MNVILNELWFNIVIRILITAYGISGIGNLLSYTPGQRKCDDDILRLNKSNYTFRLITSLMFFFLGISQFQYPILVYLTMLEIVIVIAVYLNLIIRKNKQIEEHNEKVYTIKKRKIEELRKH